MNYQQVLRKLEALRGLIEKGRDASGALTEEDLAELAMLYGECEPVISQVLGIQKIQVSASHGAVETYSNMIEAGYLSSRTMHRWAGYQQLLKVIGRIRQLAEDPGIPQQPASIAELVRTLGRFRECCQFLGTPPSNERLYRTCSGLCFGLTSTE